MYKHYTSLCVSRSGSSICLYSIIQSGPLCSVFVLALHKPATGHSITCQGSDVTLQCVILRNGVPVDPVWRRNGTIVDTNVFTNHQFVFNSTTNVNDLVITNVGPEDNSIEYECSVPLSNITSTVILNVTGQ